MNYLEKALELMKEATGLTGNRIHHVNVFHDDYCRVFDGGSCNCNPDVELTKPPAWFTAPNN